MSAASPPVPFSQKSIVRVPHQEYGALPWKTTPPKRESVRLDDNRAAASHIQAFTFQNLMHSVVGI